MNLDKETFTAISAGIAAIGAVISFIKSFIGPKDKINIGFGYPSQNYERGSFMDIQNLSVHLIKIRDLGFIKTDGSQLSIIDHIAACNGQDKNSYHGKLDLHTREMCNACYGHDLEYIAAYGYTTTQKYPSICFIQKAGIFQRVKIRFIIYKRFLLGYSYW